MDEVHTTDFQKCLTPTTRSRGFGRTGSPPEACCVRITLTAAAILLLLLLFSSQL